ncbi:MAG: hypothetical protein KGJ90_06470 [Patescibacteria group bacterium]|nr:hypothetical protein [Patescibacteria group bacterium]
MDELGGIERDSIKMVLGGKEKKILEPEDEERVGYELILLSKRGYRGIDFTIGNIRMMEEEFVGLTVEIETDIKDLRKILEEAEEEGKEYAMAVIDGQVFRLEREEMEVYAIMNSGGGLEFNFLTQFFTLPLSALGGERTVDRNFGKFHLLEQELAQRLKIKIEKKRLFGLQKINREMKNKIEQAVSMEVTREEGQTKFRFKVNPLLTDYFRDAVNGEKQTSEKWKGMEFFKMSQALENNDVYQQALSRHCLIDNYGSSLIYNGKFNIAWLRTVGGRGEIKLNDTIIFGEVSYLIKHTIAFLNDFFGEILAEFEIEGTISVRVK